MEGIISADKILLIVIFVLPGFISMKIWSLLNASKEFTLSDSLVEAICYSAFNFSSLFWLIPIANSQSNNIIEILIYISMLFLAPIIWPILLNIILKSKIFHGRIVHPTPTSWDHFFSKGSQCFMLIHLKNGNLIGGLYYKDSFASSYPQEKDLYLKEVWQINKKGIFKNKVSGTMGMLISYEIIDYIELFNTKGEE